MDILICQTCGIIIRGKTKFCTGCGATISRFSPTSLPVASHTAAPLAVGFAPDPVALERAVNKYALARTNGGNGNGNGHSSYGYEQKYFAESDSDGGGTSTASTATQDPEPPQVEGLSPNTSSQGLMSTSRLQSILGSAVGGARTTGPLSKPSMSGLISLGNEDKTDEQSRTSSSSARIDRFTFDDEPDPNPPSSPPSEPVRPAQPIFSPTTNFAQSAAAAVNSWMSSPAPSQPASAPTQEPGGHAVYSSPPAAEPEPSSQVFTPPPQPEYQAAPQVQSQPEPQPVQPSQAEPVQAAPPQPVQQPEPAPAYNYQPPASSPMAPFGSNSAFGASQFGQSSESSIAGAFAVNPYMPAAPGPIAGLATDEVVNCMSAAILNEPVVIPESPIIESNAGAPSLTLTSNEPAEYETSIFAASPYNQAQPPAATQTFAPPEQQPAAAAEPAQAASQPAAPQAIPPAPAPAPVAEPSPRTTSSNLTPAQQSSFDFFAQPPAFTTPSTNSYSNSYADSDSSSSYSSSSSSQSTSAAAGSQDVFGSGMAIGAPSIVAQAIRAAQAASAFEIPEVKQEAPSTTSPAESFAEPPPSNSDKTVLLDDDDSSSETKEKRSDDKPSTKSKASLSDRPSTRRGRSDDRETKKEEPKTISIGSITMKQSTAMTMVVLSLFVGFPLFMLVNWIGSSLSHGGAPGAAGGQAHAGAGSGLGGMFNSSTPNLSGRWELGFLGTNGQANQGTLNITQRGSDVDGWGVDKAPFLIKGTLAYPKLQFNKQYIANGQKQGKPILYSGSVDWVNPQPQAPFMHVAGMWTFSKRDGFGWRGQIVTRSNKFEMQQVEKIDPATVAANNPANGEKIAFSTPGPGAPHAPAVGGQMPQASDHAGWANFFMRIAGGLLLFGMVLIFLSVKLFGPSGTINILSKKEYIPSQFKSQHYKMVAELGKMLKPGGLPLGIRDDWSIFEFWRARRLALPPEVRDNNPHLILLGAGQKGKSRLMATMIAHDIESNDRAVVVVDSDGGLIDLLLTWIGNHPKGNEIAKRVLLIDPTHGGDSMGYNPLEFPEDGDLQNAASAIVFGFKAIYTEPPGSQSQWTQQTANILRNSAVLLMANNKTLTDLPVLLSENDFRDVLLEKVERLRGEKAEYTTLLEAWAQYKRLARTDQWINWVEPILNRVHPMLGDPRIRPILTKPKGELNLKEIIKEGKILLVKIPQSQLDQNANLLGSLIVTGLKQAAMSLSMKGGSRKHPCALYLDEFDTFIEKETYDAITSETKKFQIGFIGASKTLQGLPEDYRNQLIINVGTMCCFALAKKDGDMLGPQMFRVDGRKIKHQTLQNIFNKVNTSPQFELISDEEKLNIDRVVGQEERTYFCYRVGTVAGVFQMKAPEFKDIPDKDVNWTLIEQIRSGSVPKEA